MASTKTKKGESHMMKNPTLNKTAICKINLAEIDGEGSFPCPRCGATISPDDESEKVYKIVETTVTNNELIELVISCNTCGTTIKIAGFEQTTVS